MKDLKAIKIADNVYWVGAADWTVRDFHGYTTERGTTYNAFLVMADKVTLIDTVKKPFLGEMMSRISSVIEPGEIDYIISNHSEMDHSGCLPEAAALIRPQKIFASANGKTALEQHFRIGNLITPVRNGETLSLGNMNITFLETKMLHWPDSMVSYLAERNIIFSQDGFGMHLATYDLFDEQHDLKLLRWEAGKYYANILLPYSNLILKLLDELGRLNLPVDIIAPDHGPLWRKHIPDILGLYKEWAERRPQRKAVVVYDTMWESTALMAKSLAAGIQETGVSVKILPCSANNRSDIMTELLDANAIAVGSSTLNNNILPRIADVMTYVKGLRPTNMVGVAFGSFGWSGESVAQLNKMLDEMKVERISDGIKTKYVPTDDELAKCHELGRQLGEALLKKIG